VQFSLVRCLRNFSEEESRYSCKVEVELIGHKPSVSARSNKPAEAAVRHRLTWCVILLMRVGRCGRNLRILCGPRGRPDLNLHPFSFCVRTKRAIRINQEETSLVGSITRV
jgi:hypothetical protein